MAGITVINGTNDPVNGLKMVPEGVQYLNVVTDPLTGKYYKAVPGDGGGAGSAITQQFDANFYIDLPENGVLEYLCFKNSIPLAIRIGTTAAGAEIATQVVADPQPVHIMYFAAAATRIFISGIEAGTIVKYKIS